ncbi:MAG: nucleoside-diphosphate sugar epimerase/dehydratase [Bryobacteraceae bacterium]
MKGSEWELRLARLRWQTAIFAMVSALMAVSLALAFLIRFDFAIPPGELVHLQSALGIAIAAKMAAFYLFGRHHATWRYTGIFDAHRILFSQVLGSALFVVGSYLWIGPSFPRSIYAIDFLIAVLLKAAARVGIRAYLWEVVKTVKTRGDRKSVLIYGAGASGLTLQKELRSNPALNTRVLGFLDDDVEKHGQRFMGAPVIGGGREVPTIIDRLRKRGHDVDEIIIAMPSATGEKMREAVANCRAASVPVKTIPSMGELLSGKVLTSQIRQVSVEDLLGRQPVRLEVGSIAKFIRGRSVMVTGGGGSIGSELCRQVASFRPARLVVFERAESDLFRINLELQERFPDTEIVPYIGDIRIYENVSAAIDRHRVNAIFHAAAYKHVPMMEAHLVEAVKNNILGTSNLVQAASRKGVSDFVMISSDKAVNPTNVMGLTKRVAEIIAAAMPSPEEKPHTTKFVSVRFGNVLGSNGSVVPLFEKQIASGGPVTVTHPEMRRYFMTIREAVQLVLQASTMSKGSEIFVLDMGEPVRIVDLARNMIRLSGRTEQEIELRYTGLRPGEKLFEELISEGENILPTYHEKIRIFATQRMEREFVDGWVRRAEQLAEACDESELIAHMSDLVPEYQPGGHWRESLEASGHGVPEHKAAHESKTMTAEAGGV